MRILGNLHDLRTALSFLETECHIGCLLDGPYYQRFFKLAQER